MSLDEIYKQYKYGGNFTNLDINKVYKALKKNHLQVVLVKGYARNSISNVTLLYNYIPEDDEFEFIMEQADE